MAEQQGKHKIPINYDATKVCSSILYEHKTSPLKTMVITGFRAAHTVISPVS